MGRRVSSCQSSFLYLCGYRQWVELMNGIGMTDDTCNSSLPMSRSVSLCMFIYDPFISLFRSCVTCLSIRMTYTL